MTVFIHIVTTILVALAAGLSVAHALEFPGKMRLDRDTYVKVQEMYYPGFTIGGGISEGGGLLSLLLLLTLTPGGSAPYGLILLALAGMLAMHLVFWLVTQPANRYWTEGQKMGKAGSAFFATGIGPPKPETDWKEHRLRWEYSHIARAVFSSLSLLALLIALSLR